MWVWLGFIFFAGAVDSSAVMQAKTLTELKHLVSAQDEEVTLYARCQAELRGAYIPSYCYVWLKKAALSEKRKADLRKTLDDLCIQRLEEGVVLGEKSAKNWPHFGAKCQKSLKSWIEVKKYKQLRGESSEIFARAKSGSVFESINAYESPPPVFKNRIPTPRATR